MSYQGQQDAVQGHGNSAAVSSSDFRLENDPAGEYGAGASVELELLRAPAAPDDRRTRSAPPSSPTESELFVDWLRDPTSRRRQQSSVSSVRLRQVVRSSVIHRRFS